MRQSRNPHHRTREQNAFARHQRCTGYFFEGFRIPRVWSNQRDFIAEYPKANREAVKASMIARSLDLSGDRNVTNHLSAV